MVLIPARASDLVLFAQLMALSSGYDHIKAVIGSISFLHKNFNVNFPGDSFQLKTTLQSLKRKLAKAPNQALPISPSHLIAMYRLINLGNPQDLALWCSILVGFFGLLRKKSLCPDEDPSSLDPVQILTVRKVIVKRSEGIALLYINFSKTMQFGQKDLVIPLVSNNCKALDPIYHLDLLFTRTKAPPSLLLSHTEPPRDLWLTLLTEFLLQDSKTFYQDLVSHQKSSLVIAYAEVEPPFSTNVEHQHLRSRLVETGLPQFLPDISSLA